MNLFNWFKGKERIREKAEEWFYELKASSFEVVLIPAPYPQHSGHQIRICQSGNPVWYSRLCSENTSIRGRGWKRYKRPRTFIKRQHVLLALEKIANNKIDETIYVARCLDLIKRDINVPKTQEGSFDWLAELA